MTGMRRPLAPNPICAHEVRMLVRVSCHAHLGDPECMNKASASVWVCGDVDCVMRARRWVTERSGFEPIVLDYRHLDTTRPPAPSS